MDDNTRMAEEQPPCSPPGGFDRSNAHSSVLKQKQERAMEAKDVEPTKSGHEAPDQPDSPETLDRREFAAVTARRLVAGLGMVGAAVGLSGCKYTQVADGFVCEAGINLCGFCTGSATNTGLFGVCNYCQHSCNHESNTV